MAETKDERSMQEKEVAREVFTRGVRKVLAYDAAMAQLQEAGLSEAFVNAIEKDEELQKAVNSLAPNLGVAASPGWSCCVTVNNPLRRIGEEVVDPAIAVQRQRGTV
jgi:aspartate aminotransferase-like enzyme